MTGGSFPSAFNSLGKMGTTSTIGSTGLSSGGGFSGGFAGGFGGGVSQETNVTVNLKIDVSGVTDKTDKRTLAKEISAMVSKELKSKIGGSLAQSGFNRSG